MLYLSDGTECEHILQPIIRFGAGLKGKVVDAWLEGLPVVTTPVGAEGLVRQVHDVPADQAAPIGEDASLSTAQVPRVGGSADSGDKNTPGLSRWGGLCSSSDADAFATDAVLLHEDIELWAASREEGRKLVSDLFDASIRCERLCD